MTSNHLNHFAKALLNWHSTIDRNLPWKTTNDPYKIWLSEIILQQTRVAQGTPYYLKFIEAFPTVTDLADAKEDKIMKLWQGLGYYSRARNLHHAAKSIRDNYGGIFPSEYKNILALKGIGPYTAAAISSFAFGKEYPVVDGNVIRVISRYFGITDAVDTTATMSTINRLAKKLITGSHPAAYNQAIMDFGALVCTPKLPNCQECPFRENCIAYTNNQVQTIPFKSKKIKKKIRHFHYFHIEDDRGNAVINFRDKKDIWKSLYDFPCIENDTQKSLSKSKIESFLTRTLVLKNIEIKFPTKVYKHVLTHQTLYGQFYKIRLKSLPTELENFKVVNKNKFESLAFPVLLTNYFSDQKDWSLF